MKRIIIMLLVCTLCTSCLLLPMYKSYEEIGIVSNEDTVYIHKNKIYDSRSYVVKKENGDTCILRETIIRRLDNNNERVKYKEEKFLLQR